MDTPYLGSTAGYTLVKQRVESTGTRERYSRHMQHTYVLKSFSANIKKKKVTASAYCDVTNAPYSIILIKHHQ